MGRRSGGTAHEPKLRGVFHELGFYTAAAVGVVLVVTADR
jgi:hypothetical protein